MDILEIHYALDLEVDKISSNQIPDLLPAQKDTYIMRGIREWMRQTYGEFPTLFETNHKKIAQLSNLHITSPGLQAGLTPTIAGNLKEVKLDNLTYDYFVATKILADTDCGRIRVTLIQTDDEADVFTQEDSQWKQLPGFFAKSSDGTNSSLYLDGDTDKVFISYLKQPNRVFVGGYNHIDGDSISTDAPINCDIDPAFHTEIITIAAKILKTDLEKYNLVQNAN